MKGFRTRLGRLILVGLAGLTLIVLAFYRLIHREIPALEVSTEARAVGVMSLVMLLYYLLLTTNYSGRCYSVRWFLPFLPFRYHGQELPLHNPCGNLD